MDKFTIPAFGETECKENRTNATSRAFAIAEAGEGLFNAYCGMFAENGYDKREVRSCGTHRYASLFDGERGVFINYFGAVRELYMILL